MISFIKSLFPNFIKVFYHKFRYLVSNIKNGKPDKDLVIIGVTGSSGKSTTSFMIYHVLKELGEKVGLISTVGAYYNDKKMDTGLHVTTPDAHNLPIFFKRMKDESVKYVVLEISSHALAQGRLGSLELDISTITNITSDHLDWHKTWDNYAEAKSRIIDITNKTGFVILNEDDSKSFSLLKSKLNDRESVSFKKSDVKNFKSGFSVSFEYEGSKYELPVIGGYNFYNAMPSILLSKKLGYEHKDISKALGSFKTLPGHMELLQEKPFTAILDFAHNTDSLEKSLSEIKALSKGRLISLFGSAGLRDVAKRYDMGKIGGSLSEVLIITAEDPRTESLEDINSEILRGATDAGLELVKRFHSHEDYKENKEGLKKTKKGVFVFDEESVQGRIDAIEFAMSLARKGDVVVTQGKGHEQSLCFGTTEYPYDEKEILLNNLSDK